MEKTKETAEVFTGAWFLGLLPYFVVVLLAEIIEILAWVGPRPSAIKLVVACLIPHVLILICGSVPLFYRWMTSIWKFVVEQVKTLREHHWKKGLLMVLVDGVIASVAERIMALVSEGSLIADYNFRKAVFAFTICFLISLFVVFRDEVRTRFEIIAFFVIMSIGTAYVAALPVSCGISWDDETHFHHTLYLSHILHGNLSQADWDILEQQYYTAVNHELYTAEEHSEWVEKLQQDYESGEYAGDYRVWPTPEYWCYIPSVIGYTLGSALHLPYALTFILGKWFNLLAYAILIYFAIKQIKTGKLLIACVAMLPPNILMAASYARDPYMVGFILLGVCTLLGELQRPEKKLEIRDMVVIIGSLVLGVMPKAVYAPIVLLALFLPKNKFKSEKQCRIYRVCVLAATLLVLATFVLPFLFSSGGAVEDTRGGEDVGASSQTSYILADPLRYIGILMNFMLEYLSPQMAQDYISQMAYLGYAGFYRFLPVLLLVVAVTDREACYERCIKWPVRVAGVILSLGCLMLAATAMYIAFTPVGLDTINGCQYRYQLQVMFPMLYLLFGIPWTNKMDKLWYRGIVMGIMSFILMNALWTLCIAGF